MIMEDVPRKNTWPEKVVMKGFCSLFNLQGGVVISALILMTFVMVGLIGNTFRLVVTGSFSEHIGGFIFCGVHAILIITGCSLGFLGAYKLNQKLVMAGTIALVFAIVTYLISSAISYFQNSHRHVCILYHCPDSIWMGVSYWRIHNDRQLEDSKYIDALFKTDSSEEKMDDDDTCYSGCDLEMYCNRNFHRCFRYSVNFPTLDLIISVILNMLYIVFLTYVIFTNLSFAIELI